MQKHSKAKRSTPEEGTERPPSQGPPPLRRRSSKSRESTREEVHVQEESREEPLQTTESSQKNDEVDTEMVTSTIEPFTAIPNTQVSDSDVQVPVLGKQRLESILEEDEEDVSQQSQRNENAETEAAKDWCGSSQDDKQSTKCLRQKSQPTGNNTSRIMMQRSSRAVQTVRTIQGSAVMVTVPTMKQYQVQRL